MSDARQRIESKLKELTSGINELHKAVEKNKEARENFDAKANEIATLIAHKNDFQEKYKPLLDEMPEIKSKVEAVETALPKSSREGSVPGLEEELKQDKYKFSFARMGMAVMEGGNDKSWDKWAGFEKEVLENMAQKNTLTDLTTTSGGYLIPREVSQVVVSDLLPKLVAERAGFTIMTGIGGREFEIPQISSTSLGVWMDGVDSAITEGTVNTARELATPHRVAGIESFDVRFLRNINPSTERILRELLAGRIRRTLEKGYFNGSGASGEITGILNVSGLTSDTVSEADGRDADFEDFIDLEGILEDADAFEGNLAYIGVPSVRRKLRKKRIPQYSGQTDGAWVVPPMSNERLNEIIGHEYIDTNFLPKNLTKGMSSDLTPVFFANWEDVWSMFWDSLEIAVSPHEEFSKAKVKMRMIVEADMKVVNKSSVTYNAELKS